MECQATAHDSQNKQFLQTKSHNVTQRSLTGFCVVSAIFITGLLTNIIVASKIIMIGGVALPASVFIWALTYPCSDIVAEAYGRNYGHKMVLSGFVAYLLAVIVIQAAIAMPAAPFWHTQQEFEIVLGASFRVTIAVLVSYSITQFFDVFIFGIIKDKTSGKYLWLRNNISTILSQTLANIIFLTIAFAGTIPWENWQKLFINNLSVRYGLAISDTLIVYFGVYMLYKFYPELKTWTKIKQTDQKTPIRKTKEKFFAFLH